MKRFALVPRLRTAPFFFFPLFLVACSVLEKAVTHGEKPQLPEGVKPVQEEVKVVEKGHRKLGPNRFIKNEAGIWELYVEGGPYERGRAIGKLIRPLLGEQERIFVRRIKKMIPSESYLDFLRYFVGFFTRRLDHYVDRDQQLEILGISKAASSEFDHIGPPFYRMLNYHAAHDIGHALQNMELVSSPMVGCTSFSVKGSASKDGELLVGRNFDFHMGDPFSKNKIAAFYRPEKGHPFMMVTWPGMTGAVSGMNKAGLTVTLNAAKSGIPKKVGTPVSLIGREILQNASTIEEAYEVAARYKSFVAETFLVASAKDGESAVIEKTPQRMSLFRPGKDRVVCSNHFQSETFEDRKLTQEHKKANPTSERYRRLHQLLDRSEPLDPRSAADLLRDHKGLDDKNIGLGNERALNQFVAHHSIIFDPKERKVWLSAFPYQLGRYVAYDLDSVFAEGGPQASFRAQGEDIPPSELLTDGTYERFKRFKELRGRIIQRIKQEQASLPDSSLVQNFIDSNPQYFEVYMLLGDLYRQKKRYGKAVEYYATALNKAVPRASQREHIKEGLQKALRKEK
ncbi:MAG: C45 family autoproteolytic acyltransferase/hydrolase [Flavobacteriales bacterium]